MIHVRWGKIKKSLITNPFCSPTVQCMEKLLELSAANLGTRNNFISESTEKVSILPVILESIGHLDYICFLLQLETDVML